MGSRTEDIRRYKISTIKESPDDDGTLLMHVNPVSPAAKKNCPEEFDLKYAPKPRVCWTCPKCEGRDAHVDSSENCDCNGQPRKWLEVKQIVKRFILLNEISKDAKKREKYSKGELFIAFDGKGDLRVIRVCKTTWSVKNLFGGKRKPQLRIKCSSSGGIFGRICSSSKWEFPLPMEWNNENFKKVMQKINNYSFFGDEKD